MVVTASEWAYKKPEEKTFQITLNLVSYVSGSSYFAGWSIIWLSKQDKDRLRTYCNL